MCVTGKWAGMWKERKEKQQKENKGGQVTQVNAYLENIKAK